MIPRNDTPQFYEIKTTHFRCVAEFVETRLYYMGSNFSTSSKKRSINPEVHFEQSTENRAELLDTSMGERFNVSDINTFLRYHNNAAEIAEQWFKKMDALEKQNEQLAKQNQSLRQR